MCGICFALVFHFDSTTLTEDLVKLKAYILLSLLTIFSFQANAQLFDDELVDTETLAVREKLQSVTGRILHVVRAKDYTLITNICTATLIGEDTVVTAAHCFKTKELRTKLDSIKQAAYELTTIQDFYFDIPEVTSNQLDVQISNLKIDKYFKVPKESKSKLNQILSQLPKLKDIQISQDYLKNLPVVFSTYKPRNEKQREYLDNFLKNYSINYQKSVNDMAVAKLTKKLPASDITIAELDPDNENIYTSGYNGGDLSQHLRVFKCNNDRSVIDDLLPQIDLDSFVKLLQSSNEILLSKCHEEIVEGLSGGPQIQYKNGKISLVGITSSTIGVATGPMDDLYDHVIAARAYDLKNKFHF
jgi:hypothetical protein